MSINIQEIIKEMNLEQKIGAVLTLGFAGTIPRKHIYEYITKYHCGGLRLSPIFRKFGNYVDPISGEVIVNVECKDKIKGVEPAHFNANEYKEILDELKELAAKRPLSLPLHFSFDQEGGTSANFNFGGVELFPKPMGIRASGNPENAYEVAKAVAEQSLSVGFNFLHSPVLDINVEPSNPEVCTRAYSDNADIVSKYATETCKGLKEAGMIATGKHFPGRGASAVDAHFSLPVIDVDKKTLLERELKPYKDLIDKDLLPSIMIAHSVYPAIDPEDVATVSKKVVTGLLREELGFQGVITTDSMTMGALATRYGVARACAMALEAGCDMVLMKAENYMVEETIHAIKQFIEEGRISMEELDAKVTRILSMKKEYGMFEQETSKTKPEAVIEKIKATGLAERLAYQSILPMNHMEGRILPLDKLKKTLVIEQLNNNVPNDFHWHYGYLYNQCLKLGANVDSFEIDYMVSESDTELVLKMIQEYEAIIVTNFYSRSKTANNKLVAKIQESFNGPVIIVNNTPYKLSTPENAKNVLTTLATSPRNLKAVARIIYEGEEAKGVWPLTLSEENIYV